MKQGFFVCGSCGKPLPIDKMSWMWQDEDVCLECSSELAAEAAGDLGLDVDE